MGVVIFFSGKTVISVSSSSASSFFLDAASLVFGGLGRNLSLLDDDLVLLLPVLKEIKLLLLLLLLGVAGVGLLLLGLGVVCRFLY